MIIPFQVSFNLIELGAPPANFTINSAELLDSLPMILSKGINKSAIREKCFPLHFVGLVPSRKESWFTSHLVLIIMINLSLGHFFGGE